MTVDMQLAENLWLARWGHEWVEAREISRQDKVWVEVVQTLNQANKLAHHAVADKAKMPDLFRHVMKIKQE
jgi:hypothetical protein